MSGNQSRAVATPTGAPCQTHGSVPSGTHTMLELHGCSAELLNDPQFIERAIRDATAEGRCELIQINHHQFQPHGVTAVALLAESHMSIHTWPEHGYAAIDLFTCGTECNPQAACELLAGRFSATQQSRNTFRRGGALGSPGE